MKPSPGPSGSRSAPGVESLKDIAMPKKPLRALELTQDFVSKRQRCLVANLVGQSLGTLGHRGESHREMKPIEQVFCFGTEIELNVPHRVASVGEKLDLLVHLETLRLE